MLPFQNTSFLTLSNASIGRYSLSGWVSSINCFSIDSKSGWLVSIQVILTIQFYHHLLEFPLLYHNLLFLNPYSHKIENRILPTPQTDYWFLNLYLPFPCPYIGSIISEFFKHSTDMNCRFNREIFPCWCVYVNSVDAWTSLVTGSSTNVAACLSSVSIYVSLSFLCQ